MPKGQALNVYRDFLGLSDLDFEKKIIAFLKLEFPQEKKRYQKHFLIHHRTVKQKHISLAMQVRLHCRPILPMQPEIDKLFF